jgi:tetratricopeptide (TPR) repeat protein
MERADLLAAIKVRLERVAATRDPSPVLEREALVEAQLLAAMIHDRIDLEALALLGWLYWYRFQARPADQDQSELQTAVQMFTPCFLAGSPDLPVALLPLLVDRAEVIAHGMLQRSLGSADTRLVSTTLEFWQRILLATPPRHPGRASRLNNLGNAFYVQFGRTGQLPDLEASIRARQEALDAIPSDHPYRGGMLSNLGGALLDRFGRTGSMADLDAATTAARQAVDSTAADDPEMGSRLSNLGNALRARFERTGTTADLDEAILAGRQALAATQADHPSRGGQLSNLAIALRARFERTGTTADLDEAIEAAQAAVAATPGDHPYLPVYLANLAGALDARFGLAGTPADLDTAIGALRQAVGATPVAHPLRASVLNSLGVILRTRFERTGTTADLDEAIRVGRQALAATQADHPSHAGYLSNLGIALRARSERTGTTADLDEAIEIVQAAVAATPGDHPDLPARLSNLGSALQTRFSRGGAMADADAAIEAGQAAVKTMPDDHPGRISMLANLSDGLRIRFDRTGAEADLNAAIEAGRAAVAGTPPHSPYRPGHLTNLGNALLTRFRRTAAMADLDAAVEAGREAVNATPEDHTERATLLSNLAEALRSRFERTGQPADLDNAIDCLQIAVTNAAEGFRAKAMRNLGLALHVRFERTRLPADRSAAVSAFAAAAQHGSAAPSTRIRAARAAANLAAEFEPDRAADLLEGAVRLLAEVAPRQLQRSDQQFAIGGFAGLASDAAALILAGVNADTVGRQRPVRALQVMEAGRAVLLSQALDTRDDIADLRERHPALAEQFISLRDRLDQPEGPQPAASVPNPEVLSPPPGQAAQDRSRLAGELAMILKQIRALEEFATFGLPPSAAELLAEAASGPVVTFNVSVYGSSALLLTEGGISALELPGLAYDTVVSQINSFHQARYAAANPTASLSDRIAAQRKLLEVLEWLWDAAGGPVLDALGYRESPPPGAAWPRVWWAPGGLLGLLPVHAAGYHTEVLAGDEARRAVMDRAISSYTPTIRALRYARQHSSRGPAIPGRSLIVAMPVTPGLPDGGELPNVPVEVARVGALLPDTVVLLEPGPSEHAAGSANLPTRANVLDQLPGCTVAHFACHGFSDPADPSRSLLLLHDHDRYPLTVASLAPVDLGRAQLAYLSACETALTSTAGLIDEAIHLTTAFQLAGFPHVIGTLWKINDALAVTIGHSFYTNLRTGAHALDTSQAARALHAAVRAVRDDLPRTPSLWAAFIHAGA